MQRRTCLTFFLLPVLAYGQPAEHIKPASQITIGFSNIGAGVNAYVATYTAAFNTYAKQLGVRTVVLDSQADAARQASQIQSLIVQQVDVLIVWPINAKAVVPAVRKAHLAKIPVVITNSQIDPSGEPYTAAFSGPDDYSQARIAAQLLVDALKGQGSIVILDGLPGYTASQRRSEGFKEVLGHYPGIQVLDAQPANWSRERGQSTMENFIILFGRRIQGVLSASSDMGVGALAAAKGAVSDGRLSRLPVFTDPTLTADAYDAIKAGDYSASVLQSPEADAKSALKVALDIAQGRTPPKKVFIDTPAVTRESISRLPRPGF